MLKILNFQFSVGININLKKGIFISHIVHFHTLIYPFRLLKDSLNTTRIRSSDAPYFVGLIAKQSRVGLNLVWTFIKEQWSEWMRRYGQDIFLLGRSLKSVLTQFASVEELNDVEDFFKNKDLGSAKKALRQSILMIKYNIELKTTINNSEWFTN